jgi:hypothetical protein
MRLVAASVLLAAVSSVSVAAPAMAVPEKDLDDHLAAVWTTVLELPNPQNPFGGGPPSLCLNLDGAVAPWALFGVDVSCTVKPGTKLFVIASTYECSSFEDQGTEEHVLRECAKDDDADDAPLVTLDGKTVPVVEKETPLLEIVLPEDNVFGLPAGSTGPSVGHGWVALLHPLTPGTHTIVIDGEEHTNTTTIVVAPRR